MNKKTINILGIIVVSLLVQNLNAQTTEQMRKWAFNGVEVDFTGSTVTTQTISTQISNANGAYASYYDENDDLVVRVVDNNVYDNDNNIVGSLFSDPEGNDLLADQIVIAPQDQSNNCYYDIFYAVSVNNRNHLELRRAVYNPGIKQIVDEEVFISWPSSYTKGTIALSDFVGTTSERRLYMAVTTNNLTKSGDTLQIAYFRGPDYRHEDTYIQSSSSPAAVGELELSADMSILAYTRPFAHAGNQGQLMLHVLNSTGGFWGGTSIYYNIDPTFTKHFAGLELTNNNQYAFVNGMGDGLYRINISNLSSIYNNGYIDLHTNSSYLDFSYSQIERAHNNRYYMVKPNGDLKYFLSTLSGGILPETNIGSNSVINNAIHANDPYTPAIFNFYLIPDQIDGCEYTYTNGDEVVCCTFARESENVRTLTNVSFDANGDITISGSGSTWNTSTNPWTPVGGSITDVFLKGSITIDEDAVLTISGLTLHFKEDEGINMNHTHLISEEGSRLNLLSNAKLTAFDECDEDVLWRGIICLGDWTLSQIPYYDSQQPYVYMVSSTIEFAELGIDASGGGIVRTSNANFKDNLIDVKFAGSNNFFQTLLSNSNFYTSSELYAKGYNPNCHSQLYMGDGVIFNGCNFTNSYGYSHSVSTNNWGIGILATYSYFTVQESTTASSSFEHLYYGIKVDQGDSFTLHQSNFTDCLRGVWAISNDVISVTECDFDVYYTSGISFVRNSNFGLNFESCTGYLVSENIYRDGNVGAVIYNSGDANNEIYKNDFSNIYGYLNSGVSLIAIGDNTGYPNKTQGLHVKCNNFDDVDYSIYITGGYLSTGTGGSVINVTNSDIAANQSADEFDNELSAMNYWTNMPTPNSDYRYFYVNPNHSTIANNGRYTYHCPNTTGYYLPDGSFNSTYVARNILTAAADCESVIDFAKSSSISTLISQTEDFTEYEADLQGELDELTSYNNFELEISAHSANSINTSVVYNDLYEASPYLTSEILIAYLNNTNVSELSRVSLMLANSPLPIDVVNALEKSDLSAQYIEYIVKNQVGINIIESLQNQINTVKSARQVNYDRLVLATFSSDTTPEFADTYDFVLEFMETQTDIHAKKKLADLYVHKNMFSEAQSILNDLENIALSADDISLFNYAKLKEINIDIKQTNSVEDAQNVIREKEEYLQELALDYNTKEGGTARSMLESAGLFENFPIVFLPNSEEIMDVRSANITTPNQIFEQANPELKSLFKLYPNPANDYLSVEFINPNGACSFNIYSIKGELVKTVSSNQQLGFLSINISDLQPGNYIINCPELDSKVNFVIVR